MKKLNILVTALGGDLGQSAIKCLRESGYNTVIFGCDMNPLAGGRGMADYFQIAPPVSDGEEYENFLLNTVEREHIDYIFPMSDVEITFLNRRRDLFARTGARLIMNDPCIIGTFMDKMETVRFLENKGFRVPQTYLPEDFCGQIPFPVILKKRSGSGSRSLFIIRDEEELAFYLKRHDNMIVQEYIPGVDNEYTAGIFSDGKQTLSIVFRRKLAPGGFSGEVILVRDNISAEFVANIGAALQFTGSVNVQFRMAEGVCIPFEINPRFSSTVYLRHRFGFQDIRWSLDVLELQPVLYRPTNKKGVAVRMFGEVFFDME